jgi:hypothetical protein
VKSLFPNSALHVDKVRIGDGIFCDLYVWTSPEGVRIATHMIMACPKCGYPLTLAPSEFNFEDKTLGQKLRCPARWKKVTSEEVNGVTLRVAEINEKGKATIQKCNWQGYIIQDKVVNDDD